MRNILIIKTGAAGDVMRTSVLLHLFPNDRVYWVSTKLNGQLLPQNLDSLSILDIDDLNESELPVMDLVISLDDDMKCAALASIMAKNELVGTYLDGDQVKYTESCREWYDMGLVSIFGKEKADAIKKRNLKSYQEILYGMFNTDFEAQRYLTREDVKAAPQRKLIGLEDRAGARWPTKVWHRFDELAKLLEGEGYTIKYFQDRDTLKEYMEDIAECSLIVTGDSLGMHIALALGIPNVSIFTCTSASEIYDYGIMAKVVSPLLNDAFYTNDYRIDVLNSITVEEVAKNVRELMSR